MDIVDVLAETDPLKVAVRLAGHLELNRLHEEAYNNRRRR